MSHACLRKQEECYLISALITYLISTLHKHRRCLRGIHSKESACQSRFETWVRSLGGEDPLEQEVAPAPVFLPGEPHGQRSLAGCSPWSCKELDTTEC